MKKALYIAGIAILLLAIILLFFKLNNSTAENDKYISEISEIKSELETVKNELQKLQEENEALKSENKALKEENEKLQDQANQQANQESDALLQDNLESMNIGEIVSNPDNIKTDAEGKLTFSVEFLDMVKSIPYFSDCTTEDIENFFNIPAFAKGLNLVSGDAEKAEIYMSNFTDKGFIEKYGNENGTMKNGFRAPVEETTQPPLEHYPNQEIPPQQQQPQPEQPPQQPPVQQEPDPGNGAQNGDGTDNVTQGNDNPYAYIWENIVTEDESDHIGAGDGNLESNIGVH